MTAESARLPAGTDPTGTLQRRSARRHLLVAAALALYPAGYVAARLSGLLVHYSYGLYADASKGREHDGVYDEIHDTSFARRHPINGGVGGASFVDGVFRPIAALELFVRGLPPFEQR